MVTLQMGNAYVDGNTNTKAKFDYYWSHALISDEAYENIKSKCNFANKIYTAECDAALMSAHAEMGDLDPYNIYAPLCQGPSNATNITRSVSFYSIPPLLLSRLLMIKDSILLGFCLLKEVDPCVGNYVTSYLNHLDVQRALHANVTSLPYPWSALR